MAFIRFQDLEVYKLAEVLEDSVWDIVHEWSLLARDTVGKQLIRSADSIGVNIAEGTGRMTFADNRRFVGMARGSLYETRRARSDGPTVTNDQQPITTVRVRD